MFGKMNMKLAALAVSIVAIASPALAEMTLRYADHGSNRGTRAASTVWFLNEIEVRSEGRIKNEQMWAGALLNAKSMLEGLEAEVASIGTLIGSYYPKEFVALRVGNLPLPSPHEVAGAMTMHTMLKTNSVLIGEFERQNLKYIASVSVGPVQMICNSETPITELEDFKGLKVRYAGDYGDILAKFGAIPVAMSVTKAYQSLDSGLLDCSQAYGYLVLAFKLYEVGNQYILFNEGTIQTNVIAMNKDVFESLSPADQEMLITLGDEMTQNNARDIRIANQAAIGKLQAGVDGHVVNVTYLSAAGKVKLNEAGAESVTAWIEEANKNGIDGQAILDEFTALLAKNLKIYTD